MTEGTKFPVAARRHRPAGAIGLLKSISTRLTDYVAALLLW